MSGATLDVLDRQGGQPVGARDDLEGADDAVGDREGQGEGGARDVTDHRAEGASSVGVPASWLTPLGCLKAAGALGLLAGLLGVPLAGTAAAVGLVLFFVGAIVTHLRAGDRSAALGFPALYLLLAAASLSLGLLVP